MRNYPGHRFETNLDAAYELLRFISLASFNAIVNESERGHFR